MKRRTKKATVVEAARLYVMACEVAAEPKAYQENVRLFYGVLSKAVHALDEAERYAERKRGPKK